MKTQIMHLFYLGLAAVVGMVCPQVSKAAPIPVIFDTDIGDDIDDTWALITLLKSPQFDIQLVTTTFGKAEYRARLAAKICQAAGRTDIPIGLGAGGKEGSGPQAEWVKDYKLSDYPGKIIEDGPGAIIETVNRVAARDGSMTIIAVGPLNTLEAVLKREPALATKAHFVGMHGSVRKGYNNSPKPCVEWNVKYVSGAKAVFSAPWRSAAITPLDTCGLVRLRGENFKALKDSSDPMVKILLENYRIWAKKASIDELKESSVLFDTVAVYLATPGPKPLLELETLNIAVTDEGMTVINQAGKTMSVATNWKDLEGYHRALVGWLNQPVVKKP